MIDYPGTAFLDIDGTLIVHVFDPSKQHLVEPELLPGAMDLLKQLESNGYKIILTTGRKESTRQDTEIQLRKVGVFWDQLIMGLNRGKRILINDLKPNSIEPTAQAVCVERNKGLEGVLL